jgi:alkanesulfonate monooxygenase SsuD/methylene tetrahydromethanopterin reductase-like flavin-dependent oxidoreductase (luciferase family)
MKSGIYLPNFGCCGDARVLADLAREAEDSGWDGIFLWDHLQVVEPAVDPWIALAAMAVSTRHIRLGPLVTPVPRRHIVKLAREISTLDHLSQGRLIFGAGAGYSALPDFTAFGDSPDPVLRAGRLDEGLDVLAALSSGDPVDHKGAHFSVSTEGLSGPLQRPRVPVWIAATRAAQKPLRRAARWDGLICSDRYGLEVEPDDVRAMVATVEQDRSQGGAFDVVRFGRTAGPDDRATAYGCAEAGATWWMEYTFPAITSLDETRARLHLGPPRI